MKVHKLIEAVGGIKLASGAAAGKLLTSDADGVVSWGTDKANLVGAVNHGSDATVARPTGFAWVRWKGSVQPNNWIAGDEWVNTA